MLFDEAHHNFHTTTGRYKPFAVIIANDGYKVIPNKDKFSFASFSGKADVLVIANAWRRRAWVGKAPRLPPLRTRSATPCETGSKPAAHCF